MGLLSFLGLGTSGETSSAIGAVGQVIDDLFTSDEERLSAEQVKLRLLQQPHLAQAEINKIEAGHRSVFVAGWRPFIGWVSGFGLAWQFIGHPIFEWIVAINGLAIDAPAIDGDGLMTLVISLLGLGGLRTVEKLRGKAK